MNDRGTAWSVVSWHRWPWSSASIPSWASPRPVPFVLWRSSVYFFRSIWILMPCSSVFSCYEKPWRFSVLLPWDQRKAMFDDVILLYPFRKTQPTHLRTVFSVSDVDFRDFQGDSVSHTRFLSILIGLSIWFPRCAWSPKPVDPQNTFVTLLLGVPTLNGQYRLNCADGCIPSWLSDIQQETSSNCVVLYCEWTPNSWWDSWTEWILALGD